ncbi:MAG: Rid family hydrolase [Alphaproteobacteria bacterium]
MAHVRLRKFNTRDMYPNQSLDNDVCMVVRAGNHVFVRGQTGMDYDGTIVGAGDPGKQADFAMRSAKRLLEEAGSSLKHVCKTTIYITDRAYREPVYRAIGKWLKGVHPCSTGLIVNGLARPELLMEIDIEAVIPEGKAGPVRGPEWQPIPSTRRRGGRRTAGKRGARR